MKHVRRINVAARRSAMVASFMLLSQSACTAIVGVGGASASITSLVDSKRGAASSSCPRIAAAIGTVVDLGLAAYVVYDGDKNGVQTGHYVAAGIISGDAIAGAYLTQVFCE